MFQTPCSVLRKHNLNFVRIELIFSFMINLEIFISNIYHIYIMFQAVPCSVASNYNSIRKHGINIYLLWLLEKYLWLCHFTNLTTVSMLLNVNMILNPSSNIFS